MTQGAKNYENIIIARMMPQFLASLTDDSRSITYDHNVFIIQATV
jgi:hypothetical protein